MQLNRKIINNLIQIWTKNLKDIFLRKDVNGKQVYKKMLNIINHYINANQNFLPIRMDVVIEAK